MKKGRKGWGRGVVLAALLLVSGCGGYEGISSTLSESKEGGGNAGTGITNSASSPAKMSVGDIMSVDFSSDKATIDFSGISSDAAYILALGSVNVSGSGTNMKLGLDLAVADEVVGTKALALVEEGDEEDDGYGPEEIFDSWLRVAEADLDLNEIPAHVSASASVGKAMAVKALSVGDTNTFRVLSSLSSTTSYAEVTAKARCAGDHMIFFIDTTIEASLFSDADADKVCKEFDPVLASEQEIFGKTSDVDGDGKLHVLMTRQINRLGALGGGIITGYMWAGDFYERSSSNPVSNHREAIYIVAPDPTGRDGVAISKEFHGSNLLRAVIPHEAQHVISYNQHVFVNSGVPEEYWLNEGMSHLAEDIMGYNMENGARYAIAMASPSTTPLVSAGSTNLPQRGFAYLFMRFLYEQSDNGQSFLRAMENNANHGVASIEQAFGGAKGMSSFSQMMARWSVAMAMTDRGISQDSRYIYRARVKNATTGNWQGVCLSCNLDDNRGTVVNGVHLNAYNGVQTANISPSAMMFFDLKTLPKQMALAGTERGGNFGVLIRYR